MAIGASCSTNSRRVKALVQVEWQNEGSIRFCCFIVSFRKFFQRVRFFVSHSWTIKMRHKQWGSYFLKIIVIIQVRQNTPRIQENNDTYGDLQYIGIVTRAVNIKKCFWLTFTRVLTWQVLFVFFIVFQIHFFWAVLSEHRNWSGVSLFKM